MKLALNHNKEIRLMLLILGILANSEDPDEMQNKAAFHKVSALFAKMKNKLQGKKYIILKKCDWQPLKIQKWTIPYLLYKDVWGNPSE